MLHFAGGWHRQGVKALYLFVVFKGRQVIAGLRLSLTVSPYDLDHVPSQNSFPK
jgi:hypothetical protein